MMNYNFNSIALGITILLSVSFVVVFGYILIYLKLILKNQVIKLPQILLSSAAISLGYLMVVALTLWFAWVVGIWAFAAFTFIVMYGTFYFLARRLFGISGGHRIVFPLILSILLNQIWLILLGTF